MDIEKWIIQNNGFLNSDSIHNELISQKKFINYA